MRLLGFDIGRTSRLPAITDAEAEQFVVQQLERMNAVQWKDLESFIENTTGANYDEIKQPVQAFQKTATVYRCLRVIIRNVAVGLEPVDAKGDPVSNKQLETWLAEPFPGMDVVHWLGLIVGKMVLSGGCRLVNLDPARPIEWLPYSLDECQPEASKIYPPPYYKVDQTRYPLKQIVSILDPDPTSLTDATSGVEASTQSWQVGYLANRHQERTLANGAYIPAIMTLKNKTIAPDQYKEFINRVKDNMQTARRSGTIPVFDARFEFDIKELGFKMTDLALPELIRLSKEDIGTAMGVPPALLGDSEARYANFKEQRITFLEDTIQPMQRQIAGVLNKALMPKVGGGAFVRFKESDSYVVRQMWQEQATSMVPAVGRVITANEARERLKLPPKPGGDDLYGNIMEIPYRSSMDEQSDEIPQGEKMRRAATMLLDPKPAKRTRDDELINGRSPEQRAFMWRATALHFDSLTDRYAKDTNKILRGVKAELVKSLEINWETAHTMAYDRVELRKEWEAQRGIAIKRSWAAGGKLGTAEAATVTTGRAVVLSTRDYSFSESALAEVRRRAAYFTELTEDDIFKAIEARIGEGVEGQLSLQQMLDILGDEFMLSPASAERIARTEVIGSLNAGKFDGYKQAGMGGKEWLAVQDDRTRDEHAEADGQAVDIDASFVVGGQLLAYPGDPAGDPGNIINCRCSVLPLAFGASSEEE